MPRLLIREALPSDAAAIAPLATQLDYPSNEQDIRRRLAEVQGITLVAEWEARIVAWIHVDVTRSIAHDPFPEVHGVVVDESHRGQGTGEALLRAAMEWARAQGFTKLRLRTNVIRKDAHRFYERLGFVEKKQQKVYETVL
jgi:GNAT superfamily N-acetyltransferase